VSVAGLRYYRLRSRLNLEAAAFEGSAYSAPGETRG
jgi:hypothetical protein